MKNSPYDGAVLFLQLELEKLFKEGYITEQSYSDGIEGLDSMSASEVMEMYKTWKDSDL